MKRNLIMLVGGFSLAAILIATAIIVLFSAGRSDIVTDYPASVLGVVVDGNKTVVHVEPGSAAEKAGIQVGDVLTEVNNASVLKSSAAAKGEIHVGTPLVGAAMRGIGCIASSAGEYANSPATTLIHR